nr:DNA helicase [Tanacetum cinerariifolium]
MKTKKTLVPKCYPLNGDDNIGSSDIDHHVYDVNINMSPKKQCLGGPNFISSLTVDVSPSGIQNMTPISGTTVNRDIDRAVTTLRRNDAIPDTVIPTTIRRESRGSRRHTKHNCPVIGCSSSQQPSSSGPPPEYKYLGSYTHSCQHCGALFWFEERLKSSPTCSLSCYYRCCGASSVALRTLYNVVATKEYELPTGDMLGAIVYEAGPESDMDYDIVLEDRLGHPKRVNKLHPSYMSLQFPLLFIYGEDGYSKDLKMIGYTNSSSEDRRLLHCHTLLWIDESVRVRQDETIDTYVSAELPSQHIDPQGHRIMSELMIHGLCGLANPSATCLHIDDSDLEDYTLYEFETCLNHCSKSVTDFGLRSPPPHLMSIVRNRLLMEQKSYDRQLLTTERDKLLPKLNENQCQIFDLIVNACLNNEQQLVFVYGHGGTGKTFLWKTILYTLRCERKIVLAVASSSIASLLLPAGRTAHSRFKIPLDLTDTSVYAIKKNTQLADLLKETCLIA